MSSSEKTKRTSIAEAAPTAVSSPADIPSTDDPSVPGLDQPSATGADHSSVAEEVQPVVEGSGPFGGDMTLPLDGPPEQLSAAVPETQIPVEGDSVRIPDADVDPDELEKLFTHEEWWRDRYAWLQEQDYQLRRRYSPDWVPPRKGQLSAEDRIAPKVNLVDATRISDGAFVILKRIDRIENPHEIEILRYFSQEPVASEPENHCCPLLDALHPPDSQDDIAVLPLLRMHDDPDFDTVGEGVDFIRQVFEGFAFMHQHRVVHRDVRSDNLLMDPGAMFAEKFFAWLPYEKADSRRYIRQQYTRTEKPPKYYIIDFGFSSKYREDEMPPLEPPKAATDNTYPEFDQGLLCDPFPIDVYTLGKMVERDFIKGNKKDHRRPGRRGYAFLRPVIKAMTHTDPFERPTMAEALAQLDELLKRTSWLRLRQRSAPRQLENPVSFFKREYLNLKRGWRYHTEGLPAIPKASELELRRSQSL